MYRKRLLTCISFSAVLLTLFPIASLGQTYQIPWDVIDGGGSLLSASSVHRIYTSIAQSVIGASYGNSYRVYAGFWTPSIILEPGIKEEPQRTSPVPKIFKFHPISPNPFRSKTTIRYELPEECQINLKLYNISGRLVKTLFSGKKPAGTYQIDWNTKDLPSGVYFLRLETEKQNLTRRVMIVK